MSILAGIYARPGTRLTPGMREQLARSVSRNPCHTPLLVDAEPFSVAYVDTGAYGEPGVHACETGGISLLCGDPLFRDRSCSRAEAARLLREDWLEGRTTMLSEATGVFTVLHYDATECRLFVATDKLGIRPLYHFESSGVLVIASALRIMEALPCVERTLDLDGVVELIGFSYPLDGRTAYRGVRRLSAGTALDVSRARTSRVAYHHWTVGERRADDDAAAQVCEAFSRAVRRNLGSDTSVVSFLSGGLDSRCAVAELRRQGAEVTTVTFAANNSQDRRFAALFAEQAGTRHHEYRVGALRGTAKWSHTMRAFLDSAASVSAERPRLVCSGDGGSVGLGSVYITQPMQDALERGDLAAAAAHFIAQQGIGISMRVLTRSAREQIAGRIRRNLEASLQQHRTNDLLAAFHLFLMLNDQQHHLDGHFEELDHHEIEFRLPFFDSDFLSSVLEVSAADRLYHRLYQQLLERLPAAATAVPWQTYPGHVPCPLPAVTTDDLYQWSDEFLAPLRAERRRGLLKDLQWTVSHPALPRDIISVPALRVAGLLYRLGIGDYGHAIVTARSFTQYGSRATHPGAVAHGQDS